MPSVENKKSWKMERWNEEKEVAKEKKRINENNGMYAIFKNTVDQGEWKYVIAKSPDNKIKRKRVHDECQRKMNPTSMVNNTLMSRSHLPNAA